MNNRVLVSIVDGRGVRDLFYNGLLDILLSANKRVTIASEAITVPEFVEQWGKEGIDFIRLNPTNIPSFRKQIMMRWGDRISRFLSYEVQQLWFSKRKYFYPSSLEQIQMIINRRPAIHLITNASQPAEAGLCSLCRSQNITTLGMVQSWDNIWKGIATQPVNLAVWNDINREEACKMAGYSKAKVEVIGAPQFDPYFAPGTLWSREKFAARFNLDPTRTIILFATLGYFITGFDETCWLEFLLKLIDEGYIKTKLPPQIIIRLHPWSRYEHFKKFLVRSDIRLSFVDRYLPTLTWYMTRDDVVLMANMLRHADITITPGSTITIESAIFDTPTIVPMFHLYQEEWARELFAKKWLNKHYGRINKLNLVPIIDDIRDYASAINRCLQDASWYRDQRAQLVRDYVQFTDGHSTQRLANLVLRLTDNANM